MNEIVYIDKKGRRSKKPPKGVPPFVPKKPVNGSGCSAENGIPTRPIPDWRVRKRAKRKKI